jgi:CBS domain-containing protein
MPLRAADIMRADVVTVSPELPLTELEDLFMSRRITGAPVVDNGSLVGIVSRSDIVRSLSLERSLAGIIAESLVPNEWAPSEEPATIAPRPDLRGRLEGQRVRDAMAQDVVTVRPDAPVAEVARALLDRHVHRVLVTQDGRLLGVISTLDLAAAIADGRLRDA